MITFMESGRGMYVILAAERSDFWQIFYPVMDIEKSRGKLDARER